MARTPRNRELGNEGEFDFGWHNVPRFLTLFTLRRLETVLEGFKVGTKAADWSPLLSFIEEIVKCLSQ